MFKNNNRVDRFAIRKLTVGVASVLIGVCFLEGNVNTVNANPVGGDAQTEQPAKKDEQVKPGVETEADDKTEVGTGMDTNVGKTEQGQ